MEFFEGFVMGREGRKEGLRREFEKEVFGRSFVDMSMFGKWENECEGK